MAVNTQTTTRVVPVLAPRPRIASSYTCPRCRAINRKFPCFHCGWAPDVVVGGAARDEEREDEAIAC